MPFVPEFKTRANIKSVAAADRINKGETHVPDSAWSRKRVLVARIEEQTLGAPCVNGVAVGPDGSVYTTGDVESEDANFFEGFAGGVTVDGLPLAITVAPDGKHFYVTSGCDGRLCSNPFVWVIDIPTSMVVASIPVADYGDAIAITPDGSRVYVQTGGATSVINTAANKVVATIPVGASGIAITPDGQYAYVAGGSRFGDRDRHQYGGGHDYGGK